MVSRATPVALLVAATLAPATAAPVWSVTTPSRLLPYWPRASVAQKASEKTKKLWTKTRVRRVIQPPTESASVASTGHAMPSEPLTDPPRTGEHTDKKPDLLMTAKRFL